ncbi:hypothetical protein F7Q99_36435 [Streptomyces kaniharaensis]|uniref:Uncharacterized protein n=1 Tax=Streptomyces kaniharaensis TaxID=212423 RepID=A0A6N7L1K6_9ACTN|nr:hypothetical protein [Streptomyces kaniharaensis]MQS17531.1 hypothetical protein [Streptomyces kaniharaensis]
MSKYPVFLPAVGAAVLLVTGLALLVPGTPARPPAAAPGATARAAEEPGSTDTGSAESPSAEPPPAPTTPVSAPATSSTSAPSASTQPTAAAMPSGIAAAGDGPEGDAAIQTAFTRDHPGDLPAADAARLTQLAGEVWTAETTGTGRSRWPGYFPAGQGAVSSFYYSGVRIQAAAARTEQGRPDRVQVDLLWVGTTPAGAYGDHRPATVHLARTDNTWEPVR